MRIIFTHKLTRSIKQTIYAGCKIRELFSHVHIPVSLVLRTFFQNKMYTTFQLINSVFRGKKRFNVRYKYVVTNVDYLKPNFILKSILICCCTVQAKWCMTFFLLGSPKMKYVPE